MDTTAPSRTSFSNVSTLIREVDPLIEAKLVSNIYPWSWTCIVTGLSWIIASTRCDWFCFLLVEKLALNFKIDY